MNAQDIVNAVAANLGIDQQSAERAVGTIISVLLHEAGPAAMAPVLAKLPGAEELATQHDVMAAPAPAGGLLGSLSSALGSALGDRAGALLNGINQLESLGLGVEQIRQAGTTVLAKAKAGAGAQAVSGLLASAPALKSHFG